MLSTTHRRVNRISKCVLTRRVRETRVRPEVHGRRAVVGSATVARAGDADAGACAGAAAADTCARAAVVVQSPPSRRGEIPRRRRAIVVRRHGR